MLAKPSSFSEVHRLAEGGAQNSQSPTLSREITCLSAIHHRIQYCTAKVFGNLSTLAAVSEPLPSVSAVSQGHELRRKNTRNVSSLEYVGDEGPWPSSRGLYRFPLAPSLSSSSWSLVLYSISALDSNITVGTLSTRSPLSLTDLSLTGRLFASRYAMIDLCL